jgi:hypothetical protein
MMQLCLPVFFNLQQICYWWWRDLLDIDITMDTYESWPYDLQQVGVWL